MAHLLARWNIQSALYSQ